jgi:hypothetical protein
MSHPFGGHPKLGRFVEWAQENGCKAEIKVRERNSSGQPYQALEISAPSGATAVIVDPDMEEHLAPSIVAQLQRRLGLKSPFAATPEMAVEEKRRSSSDANKSDKS